MVNLPLLLCSLMAAPQVSSAAAVERYDISGRLNPEQGTIEAEALITLLVPEGGMETLTLQLNSGFELSAVSSDVGIRRFSFDKTRVGEYRYSSVGAVLDVEFARPISVGERVILRVGYGGKLEGLANSLNLISTERTELALYCSWFPHHPESRHFLFDIDLEADREYIIASNGLVSGGDGRWRIHNEIETSDIVLFTAAGLKRKVVDVGGLEFRFYYTDVPEGVIDSLGNAAQKTLDSYTKWFGGSNSQGISVVFPERAWGGGYGRPSFIVMQYSYYARSGALDYPDLVRGLAHEAAHIWWKDASVTTWEDWLNESFGEYSALMVLREIYGEQYHMDLIAGYVEESAGTPAIWGIDRGDRAAHAALYVKGPVILGRLEAAIGREKFVEFLRTLQMENVNTTAALLDVLQRLTSVETRMRLERDLKH